MKMIIYVVKPGDTLSSIAKKYGVDVDILAEINDLQNTNTLVVGQSLIIQQNLNTVYVVKPGDTLSSIARAYHISLQEMIDLNPGIKPPYKLLVGQKLNVEPNEENRKHIILNGFAYSTSRSEEVANALDDLTLLSIFSYRYDKSGHLVQISDRRLLDLCNEYESQALLTVTNQNEKGLFSSDYADELLKSNEMQENLLNDIATKLKSTEYYGLVLDFEYIYPIDVNLYISFLEKLKDKIKQTGKYYLFVALAPKYSSNQKGVLYEAHDYKKIGEIADYIILMAYEWGYTYGPPMAVSPIQEVRRVVEYAKTVIDKKKIMLGYPNYGYDFTLPYVKGKSKAKSIDNRDMPEYAKKHHAVIQYDEYQQSPYFRYKEDGVDHIVYFSDARSIYSKTALIQEYDLAGISVWTLNKYYAPIFEIITDFYIVNKIKTE